MTDPKVWLRTIDVETVEPISGDITGSIPSWLRGTLIRNGSGVFNIGSSTMRHLFDGFSVLHRFSISDGKVTYQNRLLQSSNYLESKEANRLTCSMFGTFAHPDPCKSALGKFMSRLTLADKEDMTDNCNVSVCTFEDAIYAMTETSYIYRFNADNLETMGDRLNLSKYVAVNAATAHPHINHDGTVYNLGNSVGSQGPMYHIVEFPAGGETHTDAFDKARIVCTIPARWKMHPSYFHSFGMTDNYFVLAEMPMTTNVVKLLSMNLRQQAFDSAMEWLPKENAKWIIIDRKTGAILPTSYESPGFFCFHHINAYEDNGHVVVDLCYIKNGDIFADLMAENLMKENGNFTHSYHTRYILPLNPKSEKEVGKENLIELKGTECTAKWKKGTIICKPERLCDEVIELPRINYLYNGKNYRFAYGASQDEGTGNFSRVIKIDIETRKTSRWSRDGFVPSEPIFVAAGNAQSEDDGVIIFSALSEKDEKQVLLVILDAKTFDEVAVAEFQASGIVPKDFHGQFLVSGQKTQLY